MIHLPFWLEVAVGVCYGISQLATAAFVLFVLWPSIRNQERRASSMEAWFKKYKVEEAFWKAVDKMSNGDGLEKAGKPTTKSNFLGPTNEPYHEEPL